VAGTDHKFARIPQGVPPLIPDHLVEYEKELAGGWLPTTVDPLGGLAQAVASRSRGEHYLSADSLHLFDPATGVNLTQGVE
jgi:hypothetical protein